MSGITDLSTLLASLEPVLIDGEFVYATVQSENLHDYLALKPIGMFLETEGLTLILPRDVADSADLTSSAPLRCITMMVHSSLEAVGMTAAMAAALTKEGISAPMSSRPITTTTSSCRRRMRNGRLMLSGCFLPVSRGQSRGKRRR